MQHDEYGLTRRQRDVYNYILHFKQVNGYAPTMREIANGIITSRSFARECVHVLVDKRIVKYNPKTFRSIVILKFL